MIKLKENENILFEEIGLFKEKEINIILTNQRLVIEKNKLLFKREYINLQNIKKINGKYKFQLNNNKLNIQTNKKTYSITIDSKKKLKDLYNQLYYALYGEHPSDKLIEATKSVAVIGAQVIGRKLLKKTKVGKLLKLK